MVKTQTMWWSLFAASCYSGVTDDSRQLGEDPTSTSDDPDEPTTADPSTASTWSTPEDEGTSDDGVADSGTTAAEPTEAPLAEGISLTTVELNQGVSRSLVVDGAFVVDGELVAGRSAVVRGLWAVDPEFDPRAIDGRVLVDNGGVITTHSQVVQIDGPSDATTIQGGFLWDIPAEEINAGTQIAVEIRETESAVEGPDVLPGARRPGEGFYPLDVAGGVQRLDVMIVPITYAAGGNLAVELTQADIDEIGQSFYDAHPVREVSLSIRNAVVFPNAIGTTDELNSTLAFLVELRNSDAAPPNVYYAGVIDIGCPVVGCGSSGTNGIGVTLADESLTDAELRVSTSLWTNAISTADVMVHELGHNHGLRHVPCPNTSPANATPDYPHDDGIITGWGWAPIHDVFHGGTEYDYMTYCDPAWVSDWTFGLTQARLEAVAALASGQPSSPTTALLGQVHASGAQTWYRIASRTPPETRQSADPVTFFDGGAIVGTAFATRHEIGDGDGQLLWVDVPSAAADFDELRWEHGGAVEVVRAQQLQTPGAASHAGVGPGPSRRARFGAPRLR